MASYLHREQQHLHPAWQILILAMAAWCIVAAVIATTAQSSPPAASWVPLPFTALLLAVVYFMFARVVVTVEPAMVRVTTGYLGWPRWEFKSDQIEWFRPVTFSPLRDFGGWGVRYGRNNRMCINAAGNKGLEIKLHNRKRTYIVGSNDPDTLAAAVGTITGMPPRGDGPTDSPHTEQDLLK